MKESWILKQYINEVDTDIIAHYKNDPIAGEYFEVNNVKLSGDEMIDLILSSFTGCLLTDAGYFITAKIGKGGKFELKVMDSHVNLEDSLEALDLKIIDNLFTIDDKAKRHLMSQHKEFPYTRAADKVKYKPRFMIDSDGVCRLIPKDITQAESANRMYNIMKQTYQLGIKLLNKNLVLDIVNYIDSDEYEKHIYSALESFKCIIDRGHSYSEFKKYVYNSGDVQIIAVFDLLSDEDHLPISTLELQDVLRLMQFYWDISDRLGEPEKTASQLNNMHTSIEFTQDEVNKMVIEIAAKLPPRYKEQYSSEAEAVREYLKSR